MRDVVVRIACMRIIAFAVLMLLGLTSGSNLMAVQKKRTQIVRAGVESPIQYPTRLSSERDYGPDLPIIRSFQIGSCGDVALEGRLLVAVGRAGMFVYDVEIPEHPREIGRLDGLGNCRQVVVKNRIAYVTSRENGMFIVDLSSPQKPELLSHYDSIELATGIDVEAGVAAIANRHYGVEFVDVTNPRHPKYLGQVATGEAQSVYFANGFVYVGVWATRELVICNAVNPRKPYVVSKTRLDGYGDGIFVRGNLCFAATGHHARGMRKVIPDDPAFGKGHGMEILDISRRESPRVIGQIKLPEFYSRYVDMWDVQVGGKYAWVGDTFAGVFAIDISNPANPAYAGRIRLPELKSNGQSIPVGGFVPGDGVVYIGGLRHGLYVASAPGIAQVIPPLRYKERKIIFDPIAASASVYLPDGQVHAAAFLNSKQVLVAAGRDGVHLVEMKPGMPGRRIIPVDDIAFDVSTAHNRIYIAEGTQGLSIWNYQNNSKPVLLGRLQFKNKGVYQLLCHSDLNLVLLHFGINQLAIVDVSNPKAMKVVQQDIHPGLMYRLPLGDRIYAGRYAVCMWHRSGFFGYDLSGGKPKKAYSILSGSVNPADGSSFLGDQVLCMVRGGYRLCPLPGVNPKKTKPGIVKIAGRDISGKATVEDGILFSSSRWGKNVSAVDISEPTKPVMLWQKKVSGNPGILRKCGNMLLVPAGYGGLMVFDAKSGNDFWNKKE